MGEERRRQGDWSGGLMDGQEAAERDGWRKAVQRLCTEARGEGARYNTRAARSAGAQYK